LRCVESGVGSIRGLWNSSESSGSSESWVLVNRSPYRSFNFGVYLASSALSLPRLAAGSDWSVTSANPLRAIHVAVNRALPGATGDQAEPFLPEQGLGLAEALAAYTIGSAYVNHLDGETGIIEPGRLADLIVLDRDPHRGPPEEIADVAVLATYIDGDRVYAADDL